ncbi:MAG TPA: NAD-dependent epimerase/dehydratase family protein, partial [Rhizomicrobium sp.]|nr:NAD-dependent epimerase/dehydratase family protein [Rhizomicrobium sp.]
VVSNFVIQALKGEPITIYGEGNQTRSFCYVDDLIDGLIRLMESPDSETGPINLGNPAETTILDLAQRIIALTGSASSIVMRPLPQDDPRQRNPDISKARSVLNWKPKVPLEKGLERTIRYFEQTLALRDLRSAQAPQQIFPRQLSSSFAPDRIRDNQATRPRQS